VRKGITEQQVFEAADALLAEGARPTIERVRQTLGSGSPNTVNRHMDAWWRRLATRLNEGRPAVNGRPPELEKAFQQLWALSRSMAEATQSERIQAERTALAQDRQAVEKARRELETDRQSLMAARDLLQAEMKELRGAAAEAAKRAAQLQAENKALVHEGSGFKRERDRLSAQMELARERLEGNTKHFTEKIGAMQVAYEREIRTLKRNLEKSIQDQAKVEAIAETAQAHVAKLETELATSRANVSALTRSEKGLTERLVEQGRRLDELLAGMKGMARQQTQPRRRARRSTRKKPGDQTPAAS